MKVLERLSFAGKFALLGLLAVTLITIPVSYTHLTLPTILLV